MQNFTSSDARFVFEGNINRVYQDMLKRLKPHGSREGTDTGPKATERLRSSIYSRQTQTPHMRSTLQMPSLIHGFRDFL